MIKDLNTRLRAIFLDLDDTLISLKEASYLSFNAALRKNGLPEIGLKEILVNWDLSWREVVRSITSPSMDVDKIIDNVGKDYFEKFSEIHLNHSTIIPGALETIKKFKEMGLLTAIVSRRRRRIIIEELDKFKMRLYIDVIVGREDVARVKPAPDAVLLAAERLKVPVERCLMVGDSPNDVKAGRAAGATVAVVLTGPYGVERILEEEPDFVMGSITDLATALERSPEIFQRLN